MIVVFTLMELKVVGGWRWKLEEVEEMLTTGEVGVAFPVLISMQHRSRTF